MKIISKIFKIIYNAACYFLCNPILTVIASRTSCFEWEKLLLLKFAINPFQTRQNSFYGHAKIVKKLGLKSHGAVIEHGVFFSDADNLLSNELVPVKCWLYGIKEFITFSDHRRKIIEKYLAEHNFAKIKVHAIGPYIVWADHFMSAEALHALKKNLGRILLVYPMHSIEVATANYDNQLFLKEIEKHRDEFDTILISFYWRDLILQFQKIYQNTGFRIVCSGRREDPFFLNRQKDLFWLADMVMTNGVGTHVGYAIAMGKPCYIFQQEYSYKCSDHIEMETVRKGSSVIQNIELRKLFSQWLPNITAEQRECVQYWWGKSPMMK